MISEKHYDSISLLEFNARKPFAPCTNQTAENMLAFGNLRWLDYMGFYFLFL